MRDKLTTDEAALILGYSLRHMQHLLRQGRLQGEKFGRTWIINRAEVERVRSVQSPGGRYYPNHENVEKRT